TSFTLNISSPMGNSSDQGGQTPSTLGEQISRGNTPARLDFNEGIFQSNSLKVSPKLGSGEFTSPRSASRTRTIPVKPPSGLQIHLPGMDGILHGDVQSLDAAMKGARSINNLRSASRRRVDEDLHDIDES